MLFLVSFDVWRKEESVLFGFVNKQLLDEVEHDIMNYQNLVSVLSAEAEGTRF